MPSNSPVSLTHDEHVVRDALEAIRLVPTPTWGRDELHAGDMWNSNSVIAWVLTVTGLHERAGYPPGRAPGWHAGITVADRNNDHPAAATIPDRSFPGRETRHP